MTPKASERVTYKVLTLHQPWASLIALGVKSIETRSWSTQYRGRMIRDGRGRFHSEGASIGSVLGRSRPGDHHGPLRADAGCATRPRRLPHCDVGVGQWATTERPPASDHRRCGLGDRHDSGATSRPCRRRPVPQRHRESVVAYLAERALRTRRRVVTEVQGRRGPSNDMASMLPLWRAGRPDSWAGRDTQPHDRGGIRYRWRSLLAVLPSTPRAGATEAEA